MISHSKKKCTVEGCQWPLYARGYCLSHYKSLYLKPRMKKNKLSDKKAKIKAKYSDKRELFIAEQRHKNKEGKLFCIFCGKEITGDPSLHHGLGRDDDVMMETKYWFLSHNFCHVHIYHSMGWNKITWWNDYIKRLIIGGHKEILELEYKRMER